MKIFEFILPGIFVLIGVLGIVKVIIAKKKCTEYVEAIVVDIDESSSSDGGTSFNPVFGYRFNGMEYRRRSTFSSVFLRFNVGDHVGLYIDPDKPEKFYCPKETIHKIIGFLIVAVVGAVFMYLLTLK